MRQYVKKLAIMLCIVALTATAACKSKSYRLSDEMLKKYINETFKEGLMLKEVRYAQEEQGLSGGTCHYDITATDEKGEEYSISLDGNYYSGLQELWGEMTDSKGSKTKVTPGGKSMTKPVLDSR